MAYNNYFHSGHAQVNGLSMYHEIHGQGGLPLVLIHGGGSTIETTFGRILPLLAQKRQVIALELQAHGRTGDRPTDLSFEQDADDVAALLQQLKIQKADFLGFSNGGQTTMEIVFRHPAIINKIILCSIFYKRSGTFPQFWDGFDQVTLHDMPKPLRDGFLAVNNNPTALTNSFNKDVQRMKLFRGWSDEQIKSINVPTLVISANNDVGSPEHAVEMYRLIPNAQLAIFPGGHGTYLGAIEALENGQWPAFNATALIEGFLDQQ